MSELLEGLLEANLAAAAAIVAVLLVRGSVRRIAGAHAAYLLWVIVPAAVLATLIPARAGPAQIVTLPAAVEPAGIAPVAVEPVVAPLPEAAMSVVQESGWASVDWTSVAIAALPWLWLGGLALMLAWIASRQAMFMGDVKRGLAGPAVVGFVRPRIVTPADFAERFSPEEQALILAHEAVHLQRGDARVNAGVALARCVCWFNPLAHIGARAMRIDQELSCDASVIEARPVLKRVYAETLVKTQLASRPLPMGAYWPPEHPLMRRVEMLGRAGTVSRVRRAAGAGIVVTMLLGGSLAAWGLQPEQPGPVVVREAPLGASQSTTVQERWLRERIEALQQGRLPDTGYAQQRAERAAKIEARLKEAEEIETRLAEIARQAAARPEKDEYRQAVTRTQLNDVYQKAIEQIAPQSESEGAAVRRAVDAYQRIAEKLSGRMPRASDTPDRYRELLGDRRVDAGRAADMIENLSPEVRELLDTRPVARISPAGELLKVGEISALAEVKAQLRERNETLANTPSTNVQPAPAPQERPGSQAQTDPWLSPIRFSAETRLQAQDAYYTIMGKVTGRMPPKWNSTDLYAREIGERRADAKRAADMIEGLSPEVRSYLDTHSERMLTQERAFLQPGETSTLLLLKAQLQEFNNVLARTPATNPRPEPRPSALMISTPEEAARMTATMNAEQDAKGYDRNKRVRVRGILKEVKIPEGGRALRVVDDRTGVTWIADGPIMETAEARASLEQRWGVFVGGRIVIEGWQSKDGVCAPECRMYHGLIRFGG